MLSPVFAKTQPLGCVNAVWLVPIRRQSFRLQRRRCLLLRTRSSCSPYLMECGSAGGANGGLRMRPRDRAAMPADMGSCRHARTPAMAGAQRFDGGRAVATPPIEGRCCREKALSSFMGHAFEGRCPLSRPPVDTPVNPLRLYSAWIPALRSGSGPPRRAVVAEFFRTARERPAAPRRFPATLVRL